MKIRKVKNMRRFGKDGNTLNSIKVDPFLNESLIAMPKYSPTTFDKNIYSLT